MSTREETAELTASWDFLLSCFLLWVPGFRDFQVKTWTHKFDLLLFDFVD